MRRSGWNQTLLFATLLWPLVPLTYLHAQDWAGPVTLTRSPAPVPVDGGIGDIFGGSVALSGDTIMVAANNETTAAEQAGAVYVFSAPSWSQAQRLVPSVIKKYDNFGYSLSLRGEQALIGSSNIDRGYVYFFARAGGVWSEQQRVDAPSGSAGAAYGHAVGIAGDHALVSAPRGPCIVYAYARVGGSWLQQQALTLSDAADSDFFGLALSLNDDVAAIGAPGNAFYPTERAAVYVYTRSAEVWSQQARLTYPEPEGPPAVYFGSSVALDADTLIVGAPPGKDHTGNGRAVVYTRQAEQWTVQQVLSVPGEDSFGSGVSLSGDVAWVVARTGSLSSAYVFARSGMQWTQRQKITPDASINISIAAQAGRAALGVSRAGSAGGAYLYRNAALEVATAGGTGVDGGVTRAPDAAAAQDGGATSGAGGVMDGGASASGDMSSSAAQEDAGTYRQHSGSSGCSARGTRCAVGSWLLLAALVLASRRRACMGLSLRAPVRGRLPIPK
jgi:FG-GAP repeat